MVRKLMMAAVVVAALVAGGLIALAAQMPDASGRGVSLAALLALGFGIVALLEARRGSKMAERLANDVDALSLRFSSFEARASDLSPMGGGLRTSVSELTAEIGLLGGLLKDIVDTVSAHENILESLRETRTTRVTEHLFAELPAAQAPKALIAPQVVQEEAAEAIRMGMGGATAVKAEAASTTGRSGATKTTKSSSRRRARPSTGADRVVRSVGGGKSEDASLSEGLETTQNEGQDGYAPHGEEAQTALSHDGVSQETFGSEALSAEPSRSDDASVEQDVPSHSGTEQSDSALSDSVSLDGAREDASKQYVSKKDVLEQAPSTEDAATDEATSVQQDRVVLDALATALEQGDAPQDKASSAESEKEAPSVEAIEQEAEAARIASIVQACEEERIELHLQPVVSLPQRRLKLYEALSRLRLSTGELITPEGFLPVLATKGLSADFDARIVARALRVAHHLASRERDAAVACNLSAAAIATPGFLKAISTLVASDKEIAGRFILEIAHDVLLGLDATQIEALKSLTGLGVRVSVDGLSTLAIDPHALADRGVRYLKVPVSLLLGEEATRMDIAVADLSAVLARAGIALIVERIEHEAEVADLLDLNVSLAQGYLFAGPRPVRTDVFTPAVREKKKAAASKNTASEEVKEGDKITSDPEKLDADESVWTGADRRPLRAVLRRARA